MKRLQKRFWHDVPVSSDLFYCLIVIASPLGATEFIFAHPPSLLFTKGTSTN